MWKIVPSLAIFWALGMLPMHAQTPRPCSENSVDYGVAPQSIEEKIKVTKPSAEDKLPSDARKTLSPQGTRWYMEKAPNYASTATPWNTALYIGKAGSESVALTANFLDHGNTFSAHWINDQLLFVQVWWGRIASSDLILDVDSGKFVYDRLAHYGQLAEPC